MMCKLTLAFAAAPVVDPDRLKAASDELRRFITDSLPVGVSGPASLRSGGQRQATI